MEGAQTGLPEAAARGIAAVKPALAGHPATVGGGRRGANDPVIGKPT
jgi:hypothetical protein